MAFVRTIIIALVLLSASTGCTKPDPYGKAATEALREQDVPKAFELSLQAMSDGSTDQLVCYIAAMAKFYEGDLVACMDFANRITETDSMYSRARVIYTSAWVQAHPKQWVPKGLIDSLEKQIKVETDNQNLSVLHEARQLVYRQLWYQADSTDPYRPRYGMEMMMSATAAIGNDSVSLPSWKVMVEHNLLWGVPTLTQLLYRTADDIAGDDRLFQPQKLGLVCLAMRVAVDNEDIALLRHFAELYVKLDPTAESVGFNKITQLKDGTPYRTCLELLQLAVEQSTVLYQALIESDYPRILMPRLEAKEKENA
ncbi:MAG: hypothetical protein ACK5BQ_07755 [Ignavibacteria bacterium]|jgi:hypothetical protein